MKFSISRVFKPENVENKNDWPQKIEFSAKEIKRDSMGDPYEVSEARELSGFIIVEKEHYDRLLQIDKVAQASMYVAQASLHQPFTIFNNDGKPTPHVATLSTSGTQSITTRVEGLEFMAELSIQGRHPTFTGSIESTAAKQINPQKASKLSM